MKITIGGDVVPTKSNEKLFAESNLKELLGEKLLDRWNKSDYRFFNLETPICNNSKPIKKDGPILQAKTDTIKGIKELNPTVIGLANNHIKDCGKIGFEETISLLEKNNLHFVGVGENIDNLRKEYIIEDKEVKCGIYACCETEFSGATKDKCGANLFNEFSTFDDIKNLKNKCDRVIVIYHGMKEYYRYPSPRIQKLCHKFIEYGADIVICQHSHCIGCKEDYLDGTIIYGQGNFIFDNSNNECWKTGLIIEINFTDKVDIEYLPIVKKQEKVRMITIHDKEYNEIINSFLIRSEEITKEGFIESNYKKFAKENFLNYLGTITHKSFIYKVLNKLTHHKLTKYLYNEKDYVFILNSLQNEAHRELFIEGLQNEINDDNK